MAGAGKCRGWSPADPPGSGGAPTIVWKFAEQGVLAHDLHTFPFVCIRRNEAPSSQHNNGKGQIMWRYGAVALFLITGSLNYSPGQTVPDSIRPGDVSGLQGTWYYQGDRGLPCHIDVGPGGRLSLMNENGSESEGRILWRGRIVADTWGNLQGDVRGNAIYWHNGTFWRR